MARKAAPRSKAKTSAKTGAKAARSKDTEPSAPKASSGFGKRSMPAGAARTASVKSKPAKSHAKTPPRSVIGKAVEAVTSTMSSATALFKRRPAKTH